MWGLLKYAIENYQQAKRAVEENMALTDEQEAVLKQQLAQAQQALEELKAKQAKSSEESEEDPPEEKPRRRKQDADIAKSISELTAKVDSLEKKLGSAAGSETNNKGFKFDLPA